MICTYRLILEVEVLEPPSINPDDLDSAIINIVNYGSAREAIQEGLDWADIGNVEVVSFRVEPLS